MSQLSAFPDPLRSLLGGDPALPRPFPPTSRYAAVETTTWNDESGRVLVYLKRRFVPAPSRFATVREHPVVQGDRLDNITARYLDDPEQFWRLCDSNGALRPEELETVGRVLRITLAADLPEPTSA
jgi:hypothetical protein